LRGIPFIYSYEILISEFSFAVFLTTLNVSSDTGVGSNIFIPIREFSVFEMSINIYALPKLILFSPSSFIEEIEM
jgi:hypothetical protein